VPAISSYPEQDQYSSLGTAVSESELYRVLTVHVANLTSLLHCLGRTEVSVQVRGKFSCFVTMPVVTARSCQHLAQPRSWRITPCRLSATTLFNTFAATLHTEGRSSIRKPMTRHAVLTGTQLSWHSFPSSVNIFSRSALCGGGVSPGPEPALNGTASGTVAKEGKRLHCWLRNMQ